jgi:endonuclease G
MPWLPELDRELANSRAVVVLWSKASSDSEWVQKEARAGLAKGALVPIVLDRDSIPQEFAAHQATDLSGWKRDTTLTEVQALFRRLAGLVPPSRIDTVRPGYDPQFLAGNLDVSLPGVTGSAAVLRYNHFTIVMNPGRRLAHYSAYNVNGEQRVRVERRRDRWAPDPLLPDSLQMEHALLKHSPYDRGHLTPRATVAWGEKREAFISAHQAFYWPNVAPQHQRLNRMWWLRLENWERDVARTHGRVTGFSGPVFSDDDEPFRGELKLEDGLVALDTFRVPRVYWKVVIVAAPGGGLQMACHLMDQAAMLKAGVGRVFDLSDYQVPLEEIEARARLRFSTAVHEAGELIFPDEGG